MPALEVCAVAGKTQGLVVMGMGGASEELPALLRRVERLKYHAGAVNVALGTQRLWTSSS